MLKLVKYEFRKSLTALVTLLGVTAGLEAYFLAALYLDEENHLLMAMMLMILCAYAVAIYVFVRGVTSYSGELKSRSAYLIFMTPHSTRKIVGSKFLYTFVNGLLFAALYGALGLLDLNLGLHRYNEYEAFWGAARNFLAAYGVHVDQIILGLLAGTAYIFLSLLAVIALAYLAITLSHTLLRDRKGRGLVALLFFFLLNWLVSWISGLFPSALDLLVIYDGELAEVTGQAIATTREVLLCMLPATLISLGVIILSWLGCAWMLERKISL
ncbi:MAG: hypothetical protein ACI4O7_12520 [Aristaeellaceae bacterium]